MNDAEREEWVSNDEYLYRRYQQASNRRVWLRAHRAEIDEMARATMSGARRSHTGPTGNYLR